MKIAQIMHRGVVTATPATRLCDLARDMRDNDIGAVPICEHGHLVGIVTDRDIACRGLANGHDPRALRARDVMSDHVVFCQDDEDAEDAVLVMEIRHIRRLPVLDRRQRLVGLLSLGDISHAVAPGLSGDMLQAVAVRHA